LPVNVREPEPYLSPDEYRIPFTVAPTGGILVKGILNDSVEVNMLFDTGATYAVISEETARQLASSSSSLKSRKITLLTGGGPVESRTTTIAKVTVGDVSKENVVAAVMPESGSLVGSDAILGLSFLKDFQATVDYKNRVVILKRH
jgi:clan AA aspartic protease (TIGR02281 family)